MVSKTRTFSAKSISRHLISRALLAMVFILLALAILGPPTHATNEDQARFKRIRTQFIAALGNPGATSGNGAQSWGLWRKDPGPRGVRLGGYEKMVAAGGVAPAQWKFDSSDWWLEENGLIMEKPDFPMPAVEGCNKQDYAVLFVIAVAVEN